ncbi:MAG TPA: diguanylate cyclase [Sandaracinaceae bacterium LLY-WYZ-13_1]|nr:diguanylate cyclase [Sandaracinaceae bacterium LLY-WYZ-13_1]
MSSLVHAALTIRKTARASFGFVAVAAFGGLVLLGVFRVAPEALGLEHAAVGLAWASIFGARALKRFREREGVGEDGRWLDLELGLLLLVAAHAGVQIGGGLEGPVYPAIYVLVAFLASFARSPMGTALVLSALGLEAGLWALAESHADWQRFALHGVFIVLFGALNVVFTRAEIARVRERSRKELDDEKEKVREESRLFRLVGAASADASAHSEDKVYRSSVEQVHDALYHVLDLLKRSLSLHTCILLLEDDDGGHLRIVELATDSDDVAEGPFAVGSGAVGAVAQRGLTMNLENLKPGYKGLCYYRGGARVRCFLGVPVEEHGKVRGALCADRVEDEPFTAREEEVLRSAVAQVLRAIENERIFVQLERSKREQTYLYRASQTLGEALTEEQVIDAGLSAARDIAPYDFAAITLYDPEAKRHAVRKAVGEGADRLGSLTFRDNTSLTSMAVKNRHYLPYRGDYDEKQQVVFTRRANLRGMRSLLILPLVVREDAIGTLALAAHRADAFNDAVRPTLQVLANQLAVALSNAAAVQRLEEMATTDGLTGCLNKRAFLEELDAKLKSAARFGRKLSLLVTDIDHFKSVNDTYGHDVGDVVIKELGAILMRVKRDTDSVARFGGEEFCVLCEETDTEGATTLAERIREELGETVFQTELGKLNVKCSVGVATFPKDARTPESLFKVTDNALYAAKRSGRNRVCTSDDA